VVLNFTPIPREKYRIGVPDNGVYREIFNSDSTFYGGSNMGNGSDLRPDSIPWMNQPNSIELKLPPLAGLILIKEA
jgi:1,4-alpha-glucan branching enzyme